MLKTLDFTLSDLRTVLSADQLDLLMELYEARKSKSLQKRIRDAQHEERVSAHDFFAAHA